MVDMRAEMSEFGQYWIEENTNSKTKLERLEPIQDKMHEVTEWLAAFDTRLGQTLATMRAKLDEANALKLGIKAQRYTLSQEERPACNESLQTIVSDALDAVGPCLVEQLQQHFKAIHLRQTEQAQIAAKYMGQSGGGLVEDRLLQGLERLRRLVDAEGQILAAEEAEIVLEDLQTVLQAALEQSQTTKDERDIRRLVKAIASFPKLPVNQKGKLWMMSPTSRCISSTLTLHTYVAIKHQLPQGSFQARHSQVVTYFPLPESIVAVITNKTRLLSLGTADGHGKQPRKDHHSDYFDDIEVIRTQFKYIRKRHPRQIMFLMSITQHVYASGISTSIPHLCVNRVVPKSSVVFQLVSQGNLKALKGILQQGHASLRDHDEDGNSLLTVGPLSSIDDNLQY